MHDLKFARQIIVVLKETLKKEAAAKPVISATVHVSLSPFTHVSPESLKEAFELLLENEKFPPVKLAARVKEIKGEDTQVDLREEFVIEAVELETDA